MRSSQSKLALVVSACVLLSTLVANQRARAQAGQQDADEDRYGRVVDQAGAGLPGVEVTGYRHNQGGGYEAVSVRTDELGLYRLENVGRVVFFKKNGLRPSTEVLQRAATVANATLEPERADWKLKPCPSQKGPNEVHGMEITIQAAASTPYKRGGGTDTSVVQFTSPFDKTFLVVESGMVGGSHVWEEYLLNSTDFLEDIVGTSKTKTYGYDFKGTTSEGKRWRWIGLSEDVFQYWNVPDRSAEYFDAVISTSCLGGILRRIEQNKRRKQDKKH